MLQNPTRASWIHMCYYYYAPNKGIIMNFKSMTNGQLENLFIRYYNQGFKDLANQVSAELNHREVNHRRT